MFNKETIVNKVYEVIDSPDFKAYLERAKGDEDWRLHSPIHFNLRHINSGEITTFSLYATQDFKQVRVVEHTVYDHEWGFLPIKKPVAKKTRTNKTKASASAATKAKRTTRITRKASK